VSSELGKTPPAITKDTSAPGKVGGSGSVFGAGLGQKLGETFA
jgi:hypothetical protein